MKPKILITVEGGIVQSVNSNTDIEVVIVDYDTANEIEPVVIRKGLQDNLFKNGDAYKLVDEEEVIDYLKKEKF